MGNPYRDAAAMAVMELAQKVQIRKGFHRSSAGILRTAVPEDVRTSEIAEKIRMHEHKAEECQWLVEMMESMYPDYGLRKTGPWISNKG